MSVRFGSVPAAERITRRAAAFGQERTSFSISSIPC